MTRYAFQMVSPIPDGKMSRMVNPGRVIYRAGSLTLSIHPISACQVSNPERVIQHEALWPEVPLDTIEASVQPIASNNQTQPTVCQADKALVRICQEFIRNLFLKISR